MIDACKRASAANINIVVPYYGYARQDRKARSREPITAKLVANLIETAGANRMIALDLLRTTNSRFLRYSNRSLNGRTDYWTIF